MARRIRTQTRRGPRIRRLVRSFAVLIAVLALGGCGALIARFILPSEGIRPAEYAVAIERNVTMTTSDVVALVADIHRPKMNGAAPTILVRIPFSRTFRNSLSADAVGRFWASRGYIVVVQGTRSNRAAQSRTRPRLPFPARNTA